MLRVGFLACLVLQLHRTVRLVGIMLLLRIALLAKAAIFYIKIYALQPVPLELTSHLVPACLVQPTAKPVQLQDAPNALLLLWLITVNVHHHVLRVSTYQLSMVLLHAKVADQIVMLVRLVEPVLHVNNPTSLLDLLARTAFLDITTILP